MVLEGMVLWGANNIFSVKCSSRDYGVVQCRIKGKILDREGEQDGKEYNPLAPGDRVLFEYEGSDDSIQEGAIISKMKRENGFIRFNKKRMVPQTIAANVELLCLVASPVEPPFRPRFIDRVLVSAGDSIPVLIILNKEDQLESCKNQYQIDLLEERMESYEALGYEVERISALRGEGLELIRNHCRGKRVLFFGQSGVGKSTLLNALYPELKLKVGSVSRKHNRGRHTTTLSRAYQVDKALLIDTPGVREIVPWGIVPGELAFSFKDFLPFTGDCRYQPCLHREEPDCAVRAAVARGAIHPDRYESYLRLLEELL